MAPSPIDVANFLADAAGPLPHKGGLRAETVRVLFSQIRTELRRAGIDLEEMEEYQQLLDVVDGLKNRPDKTLPKEEKWDTDVVIRFWQTKPPNEELSLDDLRAKAVSLLAIASLARPSDLSRLDADTLSVSRSEVRLYPFRSKTSGPSYDGAVTIPFLPKAKEKACAARALVAYMERTGPDRDKWEPSDEAPRPVFLHLHPAQGKIALSSQRISKVMKSVLARLGITDRAHSTRGNAAVTALERGADTLIVQKAGRWKAAATMNKYYLKSLKTTSVASSLLTGGKG